MLRIGVSIYLTWFIKTASHRRQIIRTKQ